MQLSSRQSLYQARVKHTAGMSLHDIWMFFSRVVLALVHISLFHRISLLNYCLIYLSVRPSLRLLLGAFQKLRFGTP